MNRFLWFILIIIFLAACNADTFQDDTGNPPVAQDLKVTVRHVFQTNPYADSLVSGVTVFLFKNRQDRKDEINVLLDRVTDKNGLAEFKYLKVDSVYILTRHPVIGDMFEEASTPSGSVSFVEVRYF
jgi:hypothetical protein